MTDKDYTYCWMIDRVLMFTAVVMIFLFIEKSLNIWQQDVDQAIISEDWPVLRKVLVDKYYKDKLPGTDPWNTPKVSP